MSDTVQSSKSKKLFILPYKIESKSAKGLAEKLNVMRIKLEAEETKFKPSKAKTVINWGFHGDHPALTKDSKVLNNRTAVRRAANKLEAFQAFEKHNISTVPFTTDYSVAQGWVEDGNTVCARFELNGHSGEGLEIIEPSEFLEYDDAPLYSLYIKKKEEFRVHVVDGEVIDIQRKALKSDFPKEEANFRIRNHKNGFVFVRNDVREPEGIRELAVSAVKALGLDFGAVDIIWNKHRNQCYVLEVNTAPGLEGTTLENYAVAFSKKADDLKVAV